MERFASSNGTPLYAPFHLGQTIPAMMLAHLVVAGVVELVLTAGVIRYLQRANPALLRINRGALPPAEGAEPVSPRPVRLRWAFAGLAAMVALTPLGLLAPGGAFGEDSPADLDLRRYHLDAVPHGLQQYAGCWHNALFGGYDFTHDAHPTVGYLVSAIFGVMVIAVVLLAGYAFARRVGARRRARTAVA